MKQGEEVWVRSIVHGGKKVRGILEFEKGDELVVSFDDYNYLCVFNKSLVVDRPSDLEIEIEDVNELFDKVYQEAKIQDWNFHRVLEEFGYKVVKMEVER